MTVEVGKDLPMVAARVELDPTDELGPRSLADEDEELEPPIGQPRPAVPPEPLDPE